MNPMCQINLITTSLSEALLHSLWQGLLITVLLGIVLKLLNNASAHKRYLMATGALFLQCILFGVSFYLAYQETSILSQGSDKIVAATNLGLDLEQQFPEKDYFDLLSTAVDSTIEFSREHHFIICICWLVGSLFLSIRFAGGLLLVEKLKKSQYTVPAKWRKRVSELASHMGVYQKIHLVISDKVAVPSITGWLKPVIIIPLSVINHLPPDEIESILAHELAHIRRHDYLVSMLQAIVEIMMFFNPFIWWVSSLINEEREHCCDDLAVKVIGDYKTYIYALANLTMHSSTNNIPVGQGILAATGKKNSVIFRINRIMKKVDKKQNTQRFNVKNLAGGFIAYMFVIAFVSFTFMGSGKAQEKENTFTKSSFTTEDSTIKEIVFYEIEEDSTDTSVKSEITIKNNDNTLFISDSTEKSKFIIHTKGGEVLTIDEKPMDTDFEIIAEEIKVVKLDGKKAKENIELKIGENLDTDGIIIEEPNTNEISFRAKQDISKVTLIKVGDKKDEESNNQDKPQPIYIIDGKQVEYGKVKEIAPSSIKSIDVLKGDIAIKKFGKEAENGVVMIELKMGDNKLHLENKVEFKGSKGIYYLLDGKPITKKKFEKLDPQSIERINVLKGEAAVKLFGEKAKKGVVEIFLKNNPLSIATEEIRKQNSKESIVKSTFQKGISVFPNPSSDVFNINFNLEAQANVKVSIHDVNGKEIQLLSSKKMTSGIHQLKWNAKGMAKGLYLVNIMKNNKLFQQKIIVE